LEGKLAEIAQEMAEGEARWTASVGEAENALRDVEMFGTVWSLEIELARRHAPELAGSQGASFQEFTGAAKRLREASKTNGRAVGTFAGLRTQIAALQRTITQWLQNDEETERERDASAPLRGDE
jgi:hypothetical protein